MCVFESTGATPMLILIVIDFRLGEDNVKLHTIYRNGLFIMKR